MSIFGSKNKDDALDTLDDAAPAGTDIDGGFSAPPGRPDMPRGKARGKFRVVLLLALLAVGGGGYYYLSSVAEDGAYAPPAKPVVAAAPQSIDAPAPNPVTAAPQSIDAAMTPPPASPVPATELPPPPAAGDLPAPGITGQTALAAPPDDEPAAPMAAPVAPGGADIPRDLNVTPSAAVNPAQEPATTAVPTVVNTAAPDLPVPAAAPTPKPIAAAPAKPDPAAPSEAERAIVENAPVLDQLSHAGAETPPAAAEIPARTIPTQEALIRPLPKEYVIVRKDHGANDIDARLSAARTALAQGRIQAALELFNDLAEKYPHDRRILMGRAVALQKSGQTESALSAYESVLDADPKNLEALTNMLGLLKGQNPSLALGKLKELRDDYPANADIAAQLGIAYGISGDYPSALKYLDMADALEPGKTQVLYNRAVVYDKMGNGAAAISLYRRLLQRASEGSLDQQLPLEQIRDRLSVLR